MALRPFAWIGGAIATALLVAPFCSDSILWTVIVSSSLAGVVMLCIRRLRHDITVWAVLFCISAALFFYQVYDRVVIQPLENAVGTEVSVSAMVCDLPVHYDNSTRYVLRITTGDLPRGTKAYYYDTSRRQSFAPGDTVIGRFTVHEVYKSDEVLSKLYAKSQGEWLYLQPIGEDAAVIPAEPSNLITAVLRFRQSVRNGLDTRFTKPVAATLRAICFGDRDGMTTDISNVYRTAGLSHLLAVSGLHLTALTGLLYAILRRFLKPRVTATISIVFVCAFMALTGFPASVVRAGMMTVLLLIGRLLYRETDGFNSVGFAVTLMCVLRPTAVWDIGLQLSVCATVGLLEGYPRMFAAWTSFLYDYVDPTERRWYSRLFRSVGNGVCVTACATLPTLPAMMGYFGEISLITPLTNLVIVPIATISVCLGLLLGLLLGVGIFPTWLTDLVAVPTGLSVQLQHILTKWFSSLEMVTWYIDGWYPVVWAVGILCVWLFTRRRLIRTKLLVLGCVGCLFIGILTANAARPSVRCMALSVGEDVAVVAKRSTYAVAVVSLDREDAVYRLQDAFERNNVHRLNLLVLTDADGEGSRFLYELLSHVEVDTVCLPPSGKYLPELCSILSNNRVYTAQDEEKINLGGADSLTRFGETVALEWQGRSILVAHSESATVGDLPIAWRTVNTLVCGDKPPTDVGLLSAEEIIVNSMFSDENVLVRTTAYGKDCLLGRI